MRLPRRANRDVSVLDGAVVPLQHDGPRRSLVAVDRPARDAGNLALGDDAPAVELHGHDAADQGDIECLPLARLTPRVPRGRQEPVNPADVIERRLGGIAVLDLRLVAAAEVDAAVAAFRQAELGVEREVVEALRGDEVVGLPQAGEHAVIRDRPPLGGLTPARTGRELHRIAPGRRAGARK